MAKASKRTAKDTLDALQKQGPSFDGLLRASDDGATLEFSPGRTCSNWIAVSVDEIEDAAALGQHSCGDTTYPYVRLRLRSPPDDRSLMYARLAAAPRPDHAGASRIADALLAADPQAVAVFGRCYDAVRKEWYDCPPYRD